jgi:ABC-type sulfate transport system permease component
MAIGLQSFEDGLGRFMDDIRQPQAKAALLLTIEAAVLTTIVNALFGTLSAWVLVRYDFPGRAFLNALVDLPFAIPTLVAGIMIAAVYGTTSPLGAWLQRSGIEVLYNVPGIVLAMLFVAAPLYVSAAREAVARVDERYESVARTLGDSPLRAAWRITRPLAGRGLLAAAVVMWVRAVSEFGAIVILTYNPKVASVLAYDRFTGEGLDAALPVAAVLVILAVVPLLVLRSLRAGAALGEPAR